MDAEQELRNAAEDGDLAGLCAILATGVDVNAQDVDGWTALHYTAFQGDHANCLEALLAAGASVHVVHNGGGTPLLTLLIASQGAVACVRALITAGSDVNHYCPSAPPGWKRTPFSAALSRGQRRILKILLRAGADVRTDGVDRNHDHNGPWSTRSGRNWALVDEIRAAGGWQNYVTRRRAFIVRAFVIATRGKFCKYINAEIASFMELPGGD